MLPAPLARLLVVEDDPDILEIARLSLSVVGGYEVETCTSGARAVAAACRFRPDLILLDVMMPGCDGPQTLRALRAATETAGIPVVFMTARVDAGQVAAFRALGAIDVLFKPFDPMGLPGALRAAWERRT